MSAFFFNLLFLFHVHSGLYIMQAETTVIQQDTPKPLVRPTETPIKPWTRGGRN